MAHVRLAIDVFRPGTADEALRRTREEFIPLLRKQPGFIAYDIIRTGPDEALFIHTCETKEHAEAALQSVVAWAQANLANMIVSVDRHVGELVYTTRDE
jgi:quinol monooxygenase YgiN